MVVEIEEKVIEEHREGRDAPGTTHDTFSHTHTADTAHTAAHSHTPHTLDLLDTNRPSLLDCLPVDLRSC